MCLRKTNSLPSDNNVVTSHALSSPLPLPAPDPMPAKGSRRRRLWELSDHAHCPVIGVCLSVPAIRKIVTRITVHKPCVHDYELHCMVVSDSKRRTPLSETIQKALDQRHAQAIRQAHQIKNTETLQQWWQQAAEGAKLAETLWVTITHPYCTPELEYKVLGDVHMLQHQVGMASRLDQTQFDALLHENGVLTRHLATVQERSTRIHTEHSARIQNLDTALMRARANLLAKETALAQLREQLDTFQSASPDLQTRLALSREKCDLTEHNQALRRQLQQATLESQRHKHRADEATALLQKNQTVRDEPINRDNHNTHNTLMPSDSTIALNNRAVLCVGGRASIVPIYRQIIENTGGRFLHHDGGEEDNTAQLDATLAAADLVICQTGCVSHNAYWRVKDHCKRTGKRCLYVETPSRSALTRALDMVSRDMMPPHAHGEEV